MAVIPKAYIDSVVAIGIKDNGGKNHWIGTGFFVYRVVGNNQLIPFLISNKHVFENNSAIVLRMKEKTNGRLIEIGANLKDGDKTIYLTHPNEQIDIAVLPINGSVIEGLNLNFDGFDIDENAMSSQELRTNGVDEGNLIYMLGYPLGLVNENSNVPICRLGCISRMSEAQITEQHNMLVDIQNFPGNSGSPVISRPELMSIGGTKSLSKSVLIGIIHSYLPYRENLISTQTKRIVEVREENSGIAFMHPVEFIREIIDKIVPIHGNEAKKAPGQVSQ